MQKNYYGFILINKPEGPTSHDMVDRLRKITGLKKIGHAGTLDPFASGLLIMAIGRQATKNISQLVKLDKSYQARLKLGQISDNYDRTGEISDFSHEHKPDLKQVQSVLTNYQGPQKQIPPMHSAIKINGQKLYHLARQGQEIERPAREVHIHSLELLDYHWPYLELATRVSSGTYIRSLASDIGQSLKVGAYLENLKRTSVGSFNLKDALEIEQLTSDNWMNHLLAPSL